ncbi:MAG TPA: hypothetical protein VFE94_04095 [Candidatus Paceibacterota bacterium]|nr:hypothetical protein [Candidatus Paceibacterota bacterium]
MNDWKLFWILLVSCVVVVVAIWPIFFLLHGSVLEMLAVPHAILFLLFLLKASLAFAGVVFFGLFMAERLGLGVPFLTAWLQGKQSKRLTHDVALMLFGAVVFGLAAGIFVLVSDALFSLATGAVPGVGRMPVEIGDPATGMVRTIALSPLQGVLASLYAALSEEILLRLFGVSLLVWISQYIRGKGRVGKPKDAVVWGAIVSVALLSGFAHLPVVASFPAMSLLMVARFALLGFTPAMLFGWLYWKKGLEAAVTAHFTSEFLLFVLIPLIA